MSLRCCSLTLPCLAHVSHAFGELHPRALEDLPYQEVMSQPLLHRWQIQHMGSCRVGQLVAETSPAGQHSCRARTAAPGHGRSSRHRHIAARVISAARSQMRRDWLLVGSAIRLRAGVLSHWLRGRQPTIPSHCHLCRCDEAGAEAGKGYLPSCHYALRLLWRCAEHLLCREGHGQPACCRRRLSRLCAQASAGGR